MNVNERAAQIWPVLAFAAHNGQTLTYDQLAGLVGLPKPGLGQCLEPIQRYCMAKSLPPLTSLVVQRDTGVPGQGFYAADKVPDAHARVFRHNWLKDGPPTPADLAKIRSSEG